MLIQIDAKAVEVMAELEASRFGDVLKKILNAEKEKARDHLVHAEGEKLLRMQGRAQAIEDLLALLATAQKQVRR